MMNIKIVIAVASAAIGIGAYGMLHQPKPQPVAKIEKKETLFTVYVAKSELAQGHELTHADVIIEKWPEVKANQYGIDKNQTLDFSEHPLVRKRISAGDLLYPETLISINDSDYVDFIIKPGMVPFPIDINSDSIVGGVIRSNTFIDVLALASTNQNLANDRSVNSYKGVSLSPVLMNIKVLKVAVEAVRNKDGQVDHEKNSLILELTPKQVATLTIAKRIAQLEVHQSIKNATAKELSADAGDVLDSYHAITEFRAGTSSVK